MSPKYGMPILRRFSIHLKRVNGKTPLNMMLKGRYTESHVIVLCYGQIWWLAVLWNTLELCRMHSLGAQYDNIL